jgi:uncharacterized protein (TIGR02145 family)
VYLLLGVCLLLCNFSCFHKGKKSASETNHYFIDLRDGERYSIVEINSRVWMAENLRFDSEGSIENLNNPSSDFGRLYNLNSILNAFPKGWRIPSDDDWVELENAHGMPAKYNGKGGWRGAHAVNMMDVQA